MHVGILSLLFELRRGIAVNYKNIPLSKILYCAEKGDHPKSIFISYIRVLKLRASTGFQFSK